ncbi:MAG: hypothetical protein ACRERU_17220 [Methylococcales bacterium]
MKRRAKRPSSFDETMAAELLGKYVIIGLRLMNMRGDLKSQTQVHGTVVGVDARFGFRVLAEGLKKGKEYKLPPDTKAFHRMALGVYHLDETDEEVTNPAFKADFTIAERDA